MTRYVQQLPGPVVQQPTHAQGDQPPQKVKGRFSRAQIISILREHASGTTASELCRRYDISATSFYKWRAKFLDAVTGEPKGLVEGPFLTLKDENFRLKKLLAEAVLENALLKEMLAKKGK
jgi:putative transposase